MVLYSFACRLMPLSVHNATDSHIHPRGDDQLPRHADADIVTADWVEGREALRGELKDPAAPLGASRSDQHRPVWVPFPSDFLINGAA